MFVTERDLQKLRVRTYDELAERLEAAAKAYEPSPAAVVLKDQAAEFRSLARKLEKGNS